MRAPREEALLAHARAEATAIRLTTNGWLARIRAAATSERVTVAIPLGPIACSVTDTGARAVTVVTIAERSSACASARVVTQAWLEPIPIVGGRVLGG